MMSTHAVDMDDEDGRCLLDVICDPQALNDFLHGSDQLDGEDLLDTSADPASAFFTDASLNVQDAAVNHLSSGHPPSSSSAVDLDFLEDDILGPGSASNLPNATEPCDILQQSLQEANITEQSLEDDAGLDIGALHFSSLQPVSQGAEAGQLFAGSTELMGLQPPAVLAQQTLNQQQIIAGQVMNKAINIQPFLQQVGLGNVTLQPLPNGSPSGTLGIGQIQVVGQLSSQPVMAQQIISKAGQPTVTTVPGVSYISSPASEQQVAAVSPTNAGLVLQKSAGPNALNGNPLFLGTALGQAGVRPASGPTLMQSQLAGPNVIVQRTPTPIQPKPSASLVQHKLFQISSKPFGPSSAALALQTEAPLQQAQAPQQKAQPNVAFMAGKPGQNVVFSASGPGFSSGVFKPQQAPPQAFGKPMSLQLQGGSIVIQPQHMHQAMLQGQNQFLLQGQLTGGPLSQQLSALAPGVGGQILTAQPTGPSPNTTHIITNQGLPAQILTNQGLAGQINLGQVIAQNAHGATHILSGPIQLQAGSVGPPTVFQMPVSLAGGLGPQGTGSGTGSAVIQGVALPGQPTVLGAGAGEAQAQAGNAAPTTSLVALGNGQGSLLTVPSSGPPLTPGTQAGSTSTAPTGKIVVAPPGPAAPQDTAQVFFQQQEQRQQQLYQAALKLQQERGLNQPPHSLAPTVTTSSVPASVIVSSSLGLGLGLASGPIPDAKGHAPQPTLPVTHFQHTLPGQMAAGQQKTPTSQSPAPQGAGSDGQLHVQLPSPHQSRPPSQPQPLSRPPSRPQSRPPSQPQPLSRPPSEPLSRSCTPSQLPLQPLYVIQSQLQSPPQPGHPMRPPSQPHLQMQFQNAAPPPQVTPPPPHSQAEAQTPPHLQPPSQPLTEGPPPQAHLQLQLHCPQPPLQPVYQTVTLTAEQQQQFQMVTSQLQTMATHPNPSPQHKTIMEKLQQMQHSIILQAKPGSGQPGPTPLTSTPPTMLLAGQGSPVPQPHPTPTPSGLKPLPQGAGQAALASLLQQTASLSKTTAGTTATTRSTDSKVMAGPSSVSAPHPQQGAAVPLQIKPLAQHQMQPSLQTKTGVISSISGLNMSLSKGPIQIQLLGKGLTQLVPAGTVPTHQMESKLGSLKTSVTPQPLKESVLVERLRGDQDGVLQPDYKSSFRTHQDTMHRLLPYHLYQGTLPSVDQHRKVDEEFEAVSTQLLKRTQAMLHKYRMLLFEEARRLSPSAEMVMIDRMFIQEEKTSLSTDRQLAKEKPDEYVASSSRSHRLPTTSPPPSCSSLQESPRQPLVASSTPVHGTKLVIKQTGGSPCVWWAGVGGGPEGGEDDTLHTRSRPPPMKTYEARSRIGLKLKIKQEAGLSKVVHNTALDPVHQPVSSVIRSTECPAVSATARQLNGGLDHHTSPSPTDPHPPTTQCKLPPRKSQREAAPSGRSATDPPPAGSGQPSDGRKDVPAKCEATPAGPRQRTGRGRAEGGGRKTRTHAHPPPAHCEEPPGSKEGEGGLRPAEELVRGIIKADPTDGSWELALPPPKRTKSESFDMDNASFSSDSPQDDTLTEHLQSAIDSILNLRQPQSSLAPPVSSPYHASDISSPFSPTTHSDTYLAPNRNGGLGARTYTR